MNKTKKIIFLFFVLIVAAIAMLYAIPRAIQTNYTNQENDIDNQINQEFREKTVSINGTKQLGNIEISNIKIKLVEPNKCEVTADVRNTSDEDLPPTNVEIKVINKNGKTEEVFGGIITELIWHEENTFTTYVLADITDAYDISFEEIQNN